MKYKIRFAENGEQILVWDEETVRQYLDDCIRQERKNLADGSEFAKYYIDAYQSLRMSLFGEFLPRPDGKPVVRIA